METCHPLFYSYILESTTVITNTIIATTINFIIYLYLGFYKKTELNGLNLTLLKG